MVPHWNTYLSRRKQKDTKQLNPERRASGNIQALRRYFIIQEQTIMHDDKSVQSKLGEKVRQYFSH